VLVDEQITRYGPASEERTYYSQGPKKDMVCAKRGDFAQFNTAVAVGYRHYMVTTGGIPANWRVWFFSDDPSESFALEMFIQKPNAINVFVGDTLIAARETAPALTDPAVRFADGS
jgi:hypothetical protein